MGEPNMSGNGINVGESEPGKPGKDLQLTEVCCKMAFT